PKEDYVYAKVNDETLIVGKTRLEEFMKEARVESYSVLKSAKGKDFDGKKYVHPLLDQIPGLLELAKKSNYHIAVSEEFVDVNTGSGIVHLSPANGEEDYNIATKRKVAIFNPINDEVKFTEDAGTYAGLFVRDADEKITLALREKNALVRLGKIKHKYPLCWRSHHKIVWLARREYFYMLDRLGDKAIKAAEAVEYFFDQPKNRFLEIIKEKHPWCISRERFWGCPLPIWNCKNCGHAEQLFSRKDIVKAASELPDDQNFELHRPWIDRIVINCKKCKSRMQREEFVLDTWHNSGSAPYSSLTDEEYKKSIPAPFLTEGIDQTRGWAYTLLIENVILNNKPIAPFRSFLFQGHVLDKNGNKMSKSLGNVIDAAQLLEKYPVDLIRFYFMWKSSPIEPLNFDTDELMSRPYQVLSTLYHLHLYFKQNSNYDKFDSSKSTIKWAKDQKLLAPSDVWLLSKLQKLVTNVAQSNEKCKFHEAARALDDFIINSLSQIYIPITRGELWEEDESKKNRRFAIYAVLSSVLRTLDVLMHPFSPFTSEYLYLCTFKKMQSVLLESWPTPDQKLINDKIEESFDLLKETISASSAARMKGKLKRRWPLNEAIICVKKNQKQQLESLSDLLVAQLNVENYKIVEIEHFEGLELLKDLKSAKLPVTAKIELDRKKIGPKAKKEMTGLLQKFEKTSPDEIAEALLKENHFTFDVNGTKITLERDDFVVDFDVKEGFAFSKRDQLLVIISTIRNREMMARGLVKDLARRLQTLRKERGYNPTDVLNVASILDLDEESLEMAKEKAKELAF
ncbi:MAG: class I tRNA ligase family protein, partial [Thermoproteota archaeon]